MAPVLQCPDCGEKHPLDRVPAQGAFSCVGCGRVLKVPESVSGRAVSTVAPAAASPSVIPPAPAPQPIATAVANPNGPDAEAKQTRVAPAVGQDGLGKLAQGAGREPHRLGHVPWWMRFLLWIVAIPVGFLLVFAIARALGVFTSNQLSDLFLASNTGRFWPAARLLPFVALVAASFVQGGVYGLARLRGRRKRGAPASGVTGPLAHSRRA